MWSPFSVITSLAAGPGLFSVIQNPFNTSHTELNHTQLDTYTPYIEFARAAYCNSSKITNWDCGGLSFLYILRLYAFAGLLMMKY